MVFRAIIIILASAILVIGCLPDQKFVGQTNVYKEDHYTVEKLFESNENYLKLYEDGAVKHIPVGDTIIKRHDPIYGYNLLTIPVKPGDRPQLHFFNIYPDSIVVAVTIDPTTILKDTVISIYTGNIFQFVDCRLLKFIISNNGVPILKGVEGWLD